VARVAIDDGVAYVVWLDEGGARAELTVRLSARLLREVRGGQAPRPVVGDFVTLSPGGLVEAVEPRRTRLARRAAGEKAVEQVLAANVDLALVATTGADVNERRLERYLAIVREGGIEPVLLLTKTDAMPDVAEALERLRAVAGGATVLGVSAATGEGVEAVAALVAPDRTAVLLGSSGVGKSTLVNRLLGAELQRVGALMKGGRGRHTTSRRCLFALPGGGALLDTPGLREVGLLSDDEARRARR
jgi:ribosome biogenesis GTPase